MRKAIQKLWTEWFTIPLVFAIWFGSIPILHWVDPTSGTYDAGVLQKLIWVSIGLVSLNFLSWLGIKTNFFGFFPYYRDAFEAEFSQQTAKFKICAILFIYSVLMLSGALLFLGI